MGVAMSYRRLSVEEFERLQRKSKAAKKYFIESSQEYIPGLEELTRELDSRKGEPPHPGEAALRELIAKFQPQGRKSDGRYLSIDKDWQALHFLLTGDDGSNTELAGPLVNAVMGGAETAWECTYGHVRSLTPAEVRETAEALAEISVAELCSRFDADALNEAKIYPSGKRGEWTVEEAEPLGLVFQSVVEFFQSAAREGEMVLMSMD